MTESNGRWSCLLLCVVLAASTVVRVAAGWNQFWLDEIWSLMWSKEIARPIEILTKIHHDNNHPLNTLQLYLLGDQANWVVYRIASMLAGVLTVLVAWRIARRESAAAGMIAALLFGFSYLLIQYQSEARGYALAVLFALVGYGCLEDFLRTSHRRSLGAYWFCSILGLLSQLVFVQFLIAAFAWSAAEEFRSKKGPWEQTRRFLLIQGVPMLAAATMYFIFVRDMQIGGGPDDSILTVVGRAAAYAVGVSPESGTAVVAYFVPFAVLAGGWVLYGSARWDHWVFFLFAILLAPALTLTARPQVLFERYFLLPVVFMLLLAGMCLARLWNRRAGLRTVAALAIVLFLAENFYFTTSLIRFGRGDYQGAMRWIAQETPGPIVSISSDHDFGATLILSYYLRYIAGGKEFRYSRRESLPREGTDWFIEWDVHSARPPSKSARDSKGNSYKFAKTFPSAPLSGAAWNVYRRSTRSN